MNTRGGLPFERLELIDDPEPRGAALNMALDEVLLGRSSQCPLLRIYRWEQASVSFGCFEPVGPIVQKWPAVELVRRWTGGGIVEHGGDLTFSLLVPRPLLLAVLPAGESYRFIHAAVSTALARAGHPSATLQMPSTVATSVSRACFENPVPYDLLLGARKVAGGAQRRTRGGLLHQGSIQDLPSRPGGTDPGEMFTALAETLPQSFGTEIVPRGVTAAELKAAQLLATKKYGAEAWLRRF